MSVDIIKDQINRARDEAAALRIVAEDAQRRAVEQERRQNALERQLERETEKVEKQKEKVEKQKENGAFTEPYRSEADAGDKYTFLYRYNTLTKRFQTDDATNGERFRYDDTCAAARIYAMIKGNPVWLWAFTSRYAGIAKWIQTLGLASK